MSGREFLYQSWRNIKFILLFAHIIVPLQVYMKQIEEEDIQSQTISFLRFPLIVAVVLIHSVGKPPLREVAFSWSVDGPMLWHHLFRYIVVDLLCRCAVPGFFILSGYLFFYRTNQWNKQVYIGKLKKRIRTLLIPYLLWNLLGAAYIFYKGKLGGIGDFLRCFYDYYPGKGVNLWPADIPLWYVRDLMLMALCTPLIHILIRRLRHWYLLILFVCFIIPDVPEIKGMCYSSLFFFSLGAYFSINGQNLFLGICRYRHAVFTATTSLLLLVLYFKFGRGTNVTWIYDAYIALSTFLVLIIAYWLVKRGTAKPTAWLCQRVFFIFAFHNLRFVGNAFNQKADYISALAEGNPLVATSSFLLCAAGKIILALLVYELLRRAMPRLLELLDGRKQPESSPSIPAS